MRSIIYLLILVFNLPVFTMENELPTIDHLVKAVKDNDSVLTQQIVNVNPALINQKFHMEKNVVTPLHIAHKKCAKILLKNGADVNARTSYGETPLDWVCLKKEDFDKPLARLLITYGADTNNADSGGYGDSLLYRVIQHNNEYSLCYVVPFLLKRGADIEKRNALGQTPFDLALIKHSSCIDDFKNAGIMFFTKDNALQNPYMLLKKNARLFRQNRYRNFSDKIDATTKMESLLVDLLMFVEKLDKERSRMWSNLLCPSSYGIMTNKRGYTFIQPTWQDLYEWVGKAGVDYVQKCLNNRCRRAYTILTTDLGLFLKIVGVYPYVLTYNRSLQQLMFEYMIREIRQKEDQRCIDAIVEYLEDINFSMNDYEETLLHRAVLHCNPLFIKILVRNKIDFTRKNHLGRTALCYAKKYKYNECIESFYTALGKFLPHIDKKSAFHKKVKQFLFRKANIHRKNIKGDTLLLNSVNEIHAPYWHSILLKLGALVNIKNNKGESPLSKAVTYKKYKTIKLLLDYGAVVTKEIVQNAPSFVKDIVKAAYEQQTCIICYEHPETLGEIPCKNRHVGSFLCQECYNGINKNCPFRCGKLHDFNSMQ